MKQLTLAEYFAFLTTGFILILLILVASLIKRVDSLEQWKKTQINNSDQYRFPTSLCLFLTEKEASLIEQNVLRAQAGMREKQDIH